MGLVPPAIERYEGPLHAGLRNLGRERGARGRDVQAADSENRHRQVGRQSARIALRSAAHRSGSQQRGHKALHRTAARQTIRPRRRLYVHSDAQQRRGHRHRRDPSRAEQIPALKVISFGSMAFTPELPLPADTEFFFRVPDRELPTLYASCDAWLFATRVEGFGLPILEAMACRTPVIGTPAGAAPELLALGGGIQVSMEDPHAMADAILRIARMSQLNWLALSDAAYTTATGYTWDDATNRLETALEQIRAGTLTPLNTTHRETSLK